MKSGIYAIMKMKTETTLPLNVADFNAGQNMTTKLIFGIDAILASSSPASVWTKQQETEAENCVSQNPSGVTDIQSVESRKHPINREEQLDNDDADEQGGRSRNRPLASLPEISDDSSSDSELRGSASDNFELANSTNGETQQRRPTPGPQRLCFHGVPATAMASPFCGLWPCLRPVQRSSSLQRLPFDSPEQASSPPIPALGLGAFFSSAGPLGSFPGSLPAAYSLALASDMLTGLQRAERAVPVEQGAVLGGGISSGRTTSADGLALGGAGGGLGGEGERDGADLTLYPPWPSLHRDRFGVVRRIGHPYQNRTPPKRKKPRTSFSRSQIVELEQRFHGQKYLASTERSSLAKQLKMSDAQVKTWFQNRRTKWRRQTAEEREVERQAANKFLLSLRGNDTKPRSGSR